MVLLWPLVVIAALLVDNGDCQLLSSLPLIGTGPLGELFQNLLPPLIGQTPNFALGTDSQYQNYATSDTSNEDIGTFTTQELIERAGFKYENHYVLETDGYITQPIRVVNPKADRSRLKQPPVLLAHGALVDPSTYVFSQTIEHHPEPWPRSPEDGPITSANSSLAFTLANNGYDVWLLPIRGCNRQNQGHVNLTVFEPQGLTSLQLKPLNVTSKEVVDTPKYWDFSFDQLISYELPAQIDRVLELTGSDKISLMTYSATTVVALSLFGTQPEYAAKIHQHIVMAPVITKKGQNKIIQLGVDMVPTINYEVGVTLVNELIFTQPVRDLLLIINADRQARYGFLRGLFTLSLGPSAKYHSNMDSGVVGHVLEQFGFRLLQHLTQIFKAGRYQKFDHGPTENKRRYGSTKPPIYNFADQHIDNWLLIHGSTDTISTQAAAQQIYNTIRTKPRERIEVPATNHLDYYQAFNNNVTVNLPILAYLDKYQLPPRAAPTQGLDSTDRKLAKFVPGLKAGDSEVVPDAQ